MFFLDGWLNSVPVVYAPALHFCFEVCECVCVWSLCHVLAYLSSQFFLLLRSSADCWVLIANLKTWREQGWNVRMGGWFFLLTLLFCLQIPRG